MKAWQAKDGMLRLTFCDDWRQHWHVRLINRLRRAWLRWNR
jgi:hypothetical protein